MFIVCLLHKTGRAVTFSKFYEQINMLSPATFQIVVKLLSVSRFLLQFRVHIHHFPREVGVHVDIKRCCTSCTNV